MLLFADRARTAGARGAAAELRRRFEAVVAMTRGLERHEACVALFIRAAELAQGVADADFAVAGEDRPTSARAATERLLSASADLMAQSWRGVAHLSLRSSGGVFSTLCEAPECVSCRTQEGYAYYGVYPEAYVEAASILDGHAPAVVGIRTIGVGLGAALACAASASLSISVRPVGHPFHRRLALSSRTKVLLARRKDGVFAVADEGPGLSGSSFAAAAEELERLGVAPSHVHFFPSHAGAPGIAASAAVQARWSNSCKHVAPFDSVVPARLASWCADLTGPALQPLEDIGAGGWRRHRPPPARDAPVQPTRERRKYLLTSERGVFLLRFAGLGDYGARTLARAQALAEAGFSPPALGLRHGFLVEPWLSDAGALRPEERRRELIARVADYLAFRARRLLAGPDSGAHLMELADMLALNAQEGLGIGLDPARWKKRASALESHMRRVQTDNRLQPWEWLTTPNGLLKADAYDHCAGHDLVGCQDIAWDVAGAIVEFGLSAIERLSFCDVLRGRGVRVDVDLLEFLLPCYLAFQLAVSEEAASLSGSNSADRERARGEARRYGAELRRILCDWS